MRVETGVMVGVAVGGVAVGWRLGDGAAGVAVNVAFADGAEAETVSMATLPIGDGNSSTISGVGPELWDPHATIKGRDDAMRIKNVTWKSRSRNFCLTAI